MADKLLDMALKQRDEIIAEIGKLPLYKRLKRVEDVIRLLGEEHEGEQTPRRMQIVAPAKQPRRQKKTETKEARILQLAAEVMRKGDGYATMRTIHEHLTENDIGVSEPSLSAYLSRAPQFAYNSSRKAWHELSETPLGNNKSAAVKAAGGSTSLFSELQG